MIGHQGYSVMNCTLRGEQRHAGRLRPPAHKVANVDTTAVARLSQSPVVACEETTCS